MLLFASLILFFLFFFLILLGGQLDFSPIKGGLFENPTDGAEDQVVFLLVQIDELKADLDQLTTAVADANRGKQDAEALVVVLRGEIEGLLRRLDDLRKRAANRWPPAITLEDNAGYRFPFGSSDLTFEFQRLLLSEAIPNLLNILNDERFDIEVIEIVGHTDAVPFDGHRGNLVDSNRGNLDANIQQYVLGRSNPSLEAGDNAGLGLARASAVARFLRLSGLIPAEHELLPLSAGHLIGTDNRLAPYQSHPVRDLSRRRMEIRVRGDFKAQ